jgi:hypothetical protein
VNGSGGRCETIKSSHLRASWNNDEEIVVMVHCRPDCNCVVGGGECCSAFLQQEKKIGPLAVRG